MDNPAYWPAPSEFLLMFAWMTAVMLGMTAVSALVVWLQTKAGRSLRAQKLIVLGVFCTAYVVIIWTTSPLFSLVPGRLTLVADSTQYFSPADSSDVRLQSLRYSASRQLLGMVRETYPAPAKSLRLVVPAGTAQEGGVAGRFNYDVRGPVITLYLAAFRTDGRFVVDVGEVLSHEVGHLLEPSNQQLLASRVLAKSVAQYGFNHSERLEQYEAAFRDLYHRENSLVYSGNWKLAAWHRQLQRGEIVESEFLSQYVAELLGCYFSYCYLSGGDLSPAELKLAQEYIDYLNGGFFDRKAAYEARPWPDLVPTLQKLAGHYRSEK